MSRSIVLYLHMHQPFRIGQFSVFDIAHHHNYFDSEYHDRTNNERILHKVAEKSYIPTLQILKKLLDENPKFAFSLSITGTLLEQLQQWSPQVIDLLRQVVDSGRVEIVAETYHHSLAFFYSRAEFEMQVRMHKELIQQLFGYTPTAFRGTELTYNNDMAYWADQAGYKAIIAEGWDPVLQGRSPNYVYRPEYTSNIRLLLKNYRLSDDLAFRFSNRSWTEWPLTTEKFVYWISSPDQNAQVFGLFMDFETFGEHQWSDSGIFNFLEKFPVEWLQLEGADFQTISKAAANYPAVDTINSPQTITWADTERDLTAWLGNSMQTSALQALYELQEAVIKSGDLKLIEDWRKLQTSDNPYYMCTKWFKDGDVHAYFSPYQSPYDAYIYFMNAYHDLRYRLAQKGLLS